MLILLISLCICTEISCIWYRFGVDIKSYVNEKKYQYIANKSEITNYTELPYSFNINNHMGYTDHSTINIIKEFEYNGKKYILYPDLDNVKYISTCKTKKYVAKINNYYLDPIIDANQDASYIQFTNNFGKYDYSINNLEKHYYDIYNINYALEGALYLELYDKIYIEEQFYYDYEWSKKEVQKISRNVYLLDWSPYCEDEAKKYNIELH